MLKDEVSLLETFDRRALEDQGKLLHASASIRATRRMSHDFPESGLQHRMPRSHELKVVAFEGLEGGRADICGVLADQAEQRAEAI